MNPDRAIVVYTSNIQYIERPEFAVDGVSGTA